MEGWANFPHERQRLFDLITSTRANGVIAISGDVHFCELSRRDDAPYPLYDFTSSGMSHSVASWSRSANPYRLPKKVNAQLNFGHIAIDWTPKTESGNPDPEITFTARGDLGEVHFTHTERLSTLQLPAK